MSYPISMRSHRHLLRVDFNTRIFKSWLTAFLFGASWMAGSLPAQSRNVAQAEPVYWPRLDFVIPFNVDTTGQAPREIQLEYSSTGGTTWETYKRSDIRTKQFQFQAKQDGEYIFRLKTMDAQGRLFENPGEPLRILVDTTKPEGNLNIHMDRQGAMMAEFSISDFSLDPDTVELTYYTQIDTRPKSIEFELSRDKDQSLWTGKGTWNIPNDTKSLAVRLVAKDKAGNAMEVNRMPQLPRSAAASNGSMQLASGKTRDVSVNTPVGTGIAPAKMDSLPKIQVLNGPGARSPASSDASLNELVEHQKLIIDHYRQLIDQQSSANKQLANTSMFGTGSQGFRANDQGISMVAEPLKREAESAKPSSASVVVSELPESLAAEKRFNKLPVREMTDEEYERASSPHMSLVAKKTNQSILTKELDPGIPAPPVERNSSAVPPLERGLTEVPPVQFSLRNNIKPLHSNTKAFSLDYSIDNDPDAPVSSVELWGTTDQGQTWHAWGQDPDCVSPLDIEVESAGLFGFRMVIVGANGLASNRPRNGDNADAWILVDLQRPQAKIVSALYGKGKEAGSMVIEYTASDESFPDRPITLSYAETQDGPWKTIATGIRNNGRYVWPADPTLPQSIYLRIEAIDGAGNVGTHHLDTPIDVQGLAPRGRIQGFRPLSPQT